MDDRIHINILFFLTALATVFLLLMTTLPHSHCQSGQHETKFSVCRQPFNCGSLSDIFYPFWRDNRPSYCGIFKLNCGPGQYVSIEIDSQIFEVVDIDITDSTIRLARQNPVNDACAQHLTNISLSPLFSYKEPVHNITIFHDCPSGVPIGANNFTCQNDGTLNAFYSEVNQTVLHEFPGLNACESRTLIQAPFDLRGDLGFDREQFALYSDFDVKYFTGGDECTRCGASGGICGTSDVSEDQFSCFCPDTADADECRSIYQVLTVADNPYFRRRKLVILGVTSAAAAIVGLLICITICYFKCKPSKWQAKFWLMTKSNRDIEAFLKNHGAMQSRRYKFSDVKKMTNSFKIKLGQGGFGAVYRGKLPTGYHVAVKILNESKGNGEDFINEVVSISRTSHVNVVTFLGFCLEGKKKALIYEFMSNGSLEKFIFKNEPQATSSLSWEKMYEIAIGIARGLEYLHKGCNTRILHFDIKPHNILLDDNFCPKISDFGLAKLCRKKESIISMSNARGTIGYVAPEVWSRHLGGVSHKSDVYSYGMMLLEMVGGRKNINPETSHTSKIYFPHWAYKRLEMDGNIGIDGVIAQEENEIAKKMTVVGLWCIQTIPSCRPTMTTVIEMLEGSMGSLEMPPKPVFSSLLQDQQENPSLLQD